MIPPFSSASVHLQILELCDEFVPGDPPEYFFDRYCIYYHNFAASQISTKPYGKCIGPWGLGRVGFLLTKCFPSKFLWPRSRDKVEQCEADFAQPC